MTCHYGDTYTSKVALFESHRDKALLYGIFGGTPRSWAKEVLEPRSPLVFAGAGGFFDAFRAAADELDREIHLLDLDLIYKSRLPE